MAVLDHDCDAARELLRELLGVLRRVGTQRWVGEALESTALLLASAGRTTEAARVLRDARAHRRAQGEPVGGDIPALVATLEACAATVGDAIAVPYGGSPAVHELLTAALRDLDGLDRAGDAN